MTRVVLRAALLALLLTPERRERRIPGRMHRDSSIFTFCNAARDPIPLSFMGCGRNITTPFQSIAKFRRRGLIAA